MSNQSFIDLINEEQQVIYRFHDLEHVRNEVEKLVHKHLQNSSLAEIEEFIKNTDYCALKDLLIRNFCI